MSCGSVRTLGASGDAAKLDLRPQKTLQPFKNDVVRLAVDGPDIDADHGPVGHHVHGRTSLDRPDVDRRGAHQGVGHVESEGFQTGDGAGRLVDRILPPLSGIEA